MGNALVWPTEEIVALTLLMGERPCLRCGVAVERPTFALCNWCLTRIAVDWADDAEKDYDRRRMACYRNAAPIWALRTWNEAPWIESPREFEKTLKP